MRTNSEHAISRVDVTRQAELVVMEYLKSARCTQTLDAMMQRLKATDSSAVASELYDVDLNGKKKSAASHDYKSVLEYMVQTSSTRTASATAASRTSESDDASSSSKPRRRRSSSSVGSDSENSGGDAVWSRDDISRLRKAIKQTSGVDDKNERWREIATLVGAGKSKKHCYVKYKELKSDKKSSGSRDASPSTPSIRSSSSSRRSSDDTSRKNRQSDLEDQVRSSAATQVKMQSCATDGSVKQTVPQRAAAPSRDAPSTTQHSAAPTGATGAAQPLHASSNDELQVEDVDDDFDAVQIAPVHSSKLTNGDLSNGGIDGSSARIATGAETSSTRAIGRSSRAPSADEVAALQRLFFSDNKKAFSSHWEQQGFVFTEVAHLRYGLVQHEGGPCGVLAVVQAYVLRFLLERAPQDWQNPDRTQQQSALVAAMAHILHQASSSSRCILALNDRAVSASSSATARRKFMSGVMLYATTREDETRTLLTEQLAQLTAPRGNGLVLFVLSVALTKGVVEIQREMDQIEGVSDAGSGGRLIGAHDYCTQEMVNLLLCGQACSNVFNGSQLLEGSSEADPNAVVLKGVTTQATVGFLSLFEAYEYLVVGSHLKSPRFNVWVVCSESHYSVLFAEPTLLRDHVTLDARATLDLYYYDGLANQDEVIRLSVTTTRSSSVNVDSDDDADEEDTQKQKAKRSDDLVPPLNLVIQTKWPRATIDWHDIEPLL